MVKDRAGTIDAILQRLNHADKKATPGRTVFSPYFNSTNRQHQMTHAWEQLRTSLRQDIAMIQQEKEADITILNQEAYVTGSFTSAYLTDTSVAMSFRPKDTAEPGDVNENLIGSLLRGDRVLILAERGNYAYVQDESGLDGWVRKSDISTTNQQVEESMQAYDKRFYKEGVPIQYQYNGKLNVVRPGCPIYVKNGVCHVMEQSESGEAIFHPVDMISEATTIKSIETPQQLIDYICGILEGYKWSDLDCAKLFTGAGNMYGIRLPESMSDLNDRIKMNKRELDTSFQKEPDPVKRHQLLRRSQRKGFVHKKKFHHLAPGMYMFDMWNAKEPVHGGLVIQGRGKEDFAVIHMAFQIRGDDGDVETPLGMHMCGIKALDFYMNNMKKIGLKNRDFRIVKIAGPENGDL